MGNRSSKSKPKARTEFTRSLPFNAITTEMICKAFFHCLKQELNLQNIPPLVMHKCVQFYRFNEEFNTKNRYLRLSEDNRRITRTTFENSWGDYAIGSFNIDLKLPQIITWTLKVNQCSEFGSGIRCGFIDDKMAEIIEIYNSGNGSVMNTYKCSLRRSQDIWQKSLRFGYGDVYKLVLNTKDVTINCQINDEKIVQLFWGGLQSRFGEYDTCRFYLGLWETSDSVSIIDFQVMNP